MFVGSCGVVRGFLASPFLLNILIRSSPAFSKKNVKLLCFSLFLVKKICCSDTRNERTLLDPLLSEDAFIMPCKGILRFCAMSLPDLWRSRRSLKDVEGFDHSVVNDTLGACGDLPGEQQGPCLPYYVWQCGYTKKLSEVYSLMDLNFSEPIHSCFGETKVEFAHDGTCHGFAVWIDWVLDKENSIVISTGPESRYWKQGVQLLSTPVQVNPANSVMHVEANFDADIGELTFKSTTLS